MTLPSQSRKHGVGNDQQVVQHAGHALPTAAKSQEIQADRIFRRDSLTLFAGTTPSIATAAFNSLHPTNVITAKTSKFSLNAMTFIVALENAVPIVGLAIPENGHPSGRFGSIQNATIRWNNLETLNKFYGQLS